MPITILLESYLIRLNARYRPVFLTSGNQDAEKDANIVSTPALLLSGRLFFSLLSLVALYNSSRNIFSTLFISLNGPPYIRSRPPHSQRRPCLPSFA